VSRGRGAQERQRLCTTSALPTPGRCQCLDEQCQADAGIERVHKIIMRLVLRVSRRRSSAQPCRRQRLPSCTTDLHSGSSAPCKQTRHSLLAAAAPAPTPPHGSRRHSTPCLARPPLPPCCQCSEYTSLHSRAHARHRYCCLCATGMCVAVYRRGCGLA
jgi:hypothetical protein